MHAKEETTDQPSKDAQLVVLCDDRGNPTGTAKKLDAHRPPGRLHRAFSVFVFHSDGRLLLQRRASGKYHFGGLWTNTCCSHPGPGVEVARAGERRLAEEMGLQTPLREAGAFVYRAEDPESGLVEHEFDSVLVGVTDRVPTPNPAEADGWRHMTVNRVREELRANPEAFTPWFAKALEIAVRVRRSE